MKNASFFFLRSSFFIRSFSARIGPQAKTDISLKWFKRPCKEGAPRDDHDAWTENRSNQFCFPPGCGAAPGAGRFVVSCLHRTDGTGRNLESAHARGASAAMSIPSPHRSGNQRGSLGPATLFPPSRPGSVARGAWRGQPPGVTVAAGWTDALGAVSRALASQAARRAQGGTARLSMFRGGNSIFCNPAIKSSISGSIPGMWCWGGRGKNPRLRPG